MILLSLIYRMEKKPQEFCNLLIAMMKELIRIITERYPEGFTWNEKGVDVNDYKEETVKETPKEETPKEETPKETPSHDVAANIRDELAQAFMNRNSNGNLNLRHVEKSEMSHKNPALRGNVKMVEKTEK